MLVKTATVCVNLNTSVAVPPTRFCTWLKVTVPVAGTVASAPPSALDSVQVAETLGPISRVAAAGAAGECDRIGLERGHYCQRVVAAQPVEGPAAD